MNLTVFKSAISASLAFARLSLSRVDSCTLEAWLMRVKSWEQESRESEFELDPETLENIYFQYEIIGFMIQLHLTRV